MRRIGSDFIDYWQGSCGPGSSRSRFGLRLRDGHIWVLLKLGGEPPNTHGIGYPIPVEIENLPAYVRMIIDDHVLNYPTSDLMDVLTGKESFQEALQFPSARAATLLTTAVGRASSGGVFGSGRRKADSGCGGYRAEGGAC